MKISSAKWAVKAVEEPGILKNRQNGRKHFNCNYKPDGTVLCKDTLSNSPLAIAE